MIEVNRLARQFSVPGGQIWAVYDVSFAVAPGEVFALLGPNGAGKTTTLRILLGMMAPTLGSASIAGYNSATDASRVKRFVGLVSTSAGLYEHLSVRECLLYSADLYGVPYQQARSNLDRLVGLLGLYDLFSRRCGKLSTGQKQRVQLARALIHDPPVLLLDEPTQGLDVLGSQVVVEFVDHLRKEGKAVVLTTHRLEEAERLGDRFGLMHLGRLVLSGTLPELKHQTGCSSLVEMFLKLVHPAPSLNVTDLANGGTSPTHALPPGPVLPATPVAIDPQGTARESP